MADAFTPHGPEGRPREAGTFETQIVDFCALLGWPCLARNVDAITGIGRSAGLDGIFLIKNPRNGRGEIWLGDGKRHQEMSAYKPSVLAKEVNELGAKIKRLQSNSFLQSDAIAPHAQSVVGGFVFHRTGHYR